MMSHVCRRCGLDLARIRAQREPRYGLPLVLCPGCGLAAVRRPHPMRRTWASLLRLDAALTALLLQTAAAAVLGGAMVGGALVLREVAMGWDWPTIAASWRALVVIAVLGPLVTGAWLTACLGHHRVAVVWASWTALCAAAITATLAILLLLRWADLRGVADPAGWGRALDASAGPWLLSLGALALLMSVAGCGWPIGRLALWTVGRFRAWRWRSRRRLRRRWR